MDRERYGSRRSPPPRPRPYRERDDHPDVEYFGEGESYRPGGSTGDGPYRPNRDRPSADSWSSNRDYRRDERRDERREEIDSYIPSTSNRSQRPRSRSPPITRQRSRSPPARNRGELFPDRVRSPPPPARRFSPRRDDRTRSPPRRRSRSPPSPPRSPYEGKRPRDYSPDGRRSPKRERLSSPGHRGGDRPRSPPRRPYSPARGGIREPYRPRSRTPPRRDDGWKRRSPSPRRSGFDSNATSRRSSPPVHPDRMSGTGSQPRSPVPVPRSHYDSQPTPVNRGKSPPPPRDRSDRPRSPQSDHDRQRDTARPAMSVPTGPSATRNGVPDRAPPTGPSRPYGQGPQASPPLGSPAAPVSMSAHHRPVGAGVLSAPTRPRGAPPGRFDTPARDFTSPPMRGRGSLTYRAPSAPRAASFQQADSPPAGPRGSGYGRGDYGGSRGDYGGGRGDYGGGRGDYGAGRGDHGGSRGDYSGGRSDNSNYRGGSGRGSDTSFPYRHPSNSSSATYPRTQRFNATQQHLTTTEKIIPGGKLLPTGLPLEQEKRMKMLEIEAEKIRVEIMEKQKAKREALIEWEVRERESKREALRSALAEEHLQKLMEGEEVMAGAAF